MEANQEVFKITSMLEKINVPTFRVEMSKDFDENIAYNFAYSNCWASRITDIFGLEEFEEVFKSITHYFQNAKRGDEIKE